MSGSFIGSKIAIVTKSQCRYTGTIIGIDAQTSSILLGNVKCFGTENRGGNFFNNQMVGTVVPIMQFANSDIEDLKIVDEEAAAVVESTAKPQPSYPVSSPPKQASIHDDPAIVSAVVSSAGKDLPNSNRLIHDLQHLSLSEDQSSKFRKPEESRLRNDSGELGPSWSLLSPSKWDDHKPQSQQSNTRSKFFDDFKQNDNEQVPSSRSHQRWPSNTHSTQTSRQQEHRFNGHDGDDSGLPVRQPFFSNDGSHPHDMPLQPPNRYQNGHMHYQQRPSYNNNNHHHQHNRRPPVMNYQQRRPGGGNRETFQDSGNNYDNEFDFESSNRKFNKITSEDEFKQQSESPHQFLRSHEHLDPSGDFEPMYDKKKSFFDSVALEDNADGSGPVYNRSRNHDTFGNDRSNRQRGGRGGGYRRSNNQNYRQQQGNEDFYYRPNNNGYQYRH